MQIFSQLRAVADFRRRHLPFLKTLEDVEVVREIGHHQVLGVPLTLKHLVLLGAGSAATVQRRLRRLKRLGVVQERPSSADGRARELLLSPGCMKLYAKLGAFVQTLGAPPAARRGRSHAMHSCSLCGSPDEFAAFTARRIRDGLLEGERCIVLAPERLLRAVRDRLSARSDAAIHFSSGEPTVGAMLEVLGARFRDARAEGRAIRMIGHTSWARARGIGFEGLIDFERRLDLLSRRSGTRVFCAYDPRGLSGPEVLRAMRCHDLIEHCGTGRA